MTTKSLVVGSSDCPISKVVIALKSSSSFSLFHDNWMMVAIDLQTKRELVKKMNRNLHLNVISLTDILYELLEEWVYREGKNASLQTLVRILSENGLNDCAGQVKQVFLSPSSSVSKINSDPFKDFINKNLMDLLSTTNLYPDVLASLYCSGVLSTQDELTLQALPNVYERKNMFYRIVEQRPNCYQDLLEAFRYQSGVLEILQKYENT